MTDDHGTQLDRRAVLQATASAGGLSALGTVGRAEAATCPRSREYWARTDWCADPALRESDVLLLAGLRCADAGEPTVELRQTGVRKTVQEWQSFLKQASTDPVETTAQTLLTTVLNFQHLGGCVDESVDLGAYGIGETTPRTLKRRTERWVEASSFGVETNRGRPWTAGGFDVRPYQRALAAFNEGTLDTACPACRPTDGGGRGQSKDRDTAGDRETPRAWADSMEQVRPSVNRWLCRISGLLCPGVSGGRQP